METLDRPNFSWEFALSLIKNQWNITAVSYKSLSSWADQNFKLTASSGQSYVLKLTNWKTSQNVAYMQEQSEIMEYMSTKRKSTFKYPNVVRNTQGQLLVFVKDEKRRQCIARLLTYINGVTFGDRALNDDLCFQCGLAQADIAIGLKDLSYKAVEQHRIFWTYDSIPQIQEYAAVVKDASDRAEILKAVTMFEKVKHQFDALPKHIIHSDVHYENIVILPNVEKGFQLVGVIDWGNVHFGPEIFDIGVNIGCNSHICPDPIRGIGHILAGYHSMYPDVLGSVTLDAVYALAVSRVAMNLVGGLVAYEQVQDPYVISFQKPGWRAFHTLINASISETRDVWRKVFLQRNVPFPRWKE